MKTLAVIPARKGSKGIAGKNKAILDGIPLVSHTFDFIEDNKNEFITVLSTDDEEIIEISNNYSKINNFGLRPKELSTDRALTIDVLKYELKNAEKKFGNFDAVLLLQPTCPFRKQQDLRNIFDLFSKNDYSSIVSVSLVDDMHPYRMKYIDDGVLKNFIDQGFEDMRPRQELPEVYIRSGSYYLSKKSVIKNGSVVSETSIPYILSGKYALNIDKLSDLIIANHYISEAQDDSS